MYQDKSKRPIMKIPFDAIDYSLWALIVASILSGVLMVAENNLFAPELIPLGGGARAAGYGMIFFPLFGILPTIVAVWANLNPHRINFPGDITGDNAEAQYRYARRLVTCLDAEFNIALAFLVWSSLEAVVPDISVVQVLFFLSLLPAAGITLVYYLYKLS